MKDTWTENIKNNSIGKLIESGKACYFSGYSRNYHSMSRDWITNEIFRRIDPKKRTMGEYFKQELKD